MALAIDVPGLSAAVARRRCEVVPPPVPGELIRSRLVAQLAGRWDVAVTTVVAAAGFGKTTALAQAVRHNRAHPRGVDAWISCEPGDEDADRLAAVAVRALGSPWAGLDPDTAVIGALQRVSPIPVCLVVDDVQELPEPSSAVDLLASVVRRLPAHAHLVLASRTALTVPLARLRAGGRVLDVTQDDLAFTATEVGELAAHAGPAAGLEGLAGWPTLVRLALSAPPDGIRRFLSEEVVDHLTGADRRALLALATMGTADRHTLEALSAHVVDFDHLVSAIPLVSLTGDGRLRAHDLWADTLAAILPKAEVRTMGRAALGLLLESGACISAATLALRIGDIEAFCAAVLALVRSTLSSLPVDTAATWLRAAPSEHRDRPELILLEAAHRHALNHHDPSLEALLDTALARFRASGSIEGAHVVLALRLVVAYSQGNLASIAAIRDASRRLPDADRDPGLRTLAPAAEAIAAQLRGDVDEAATILEGISLIGVPPVIAEGLLRLRWHALVFAGRADDAARLGQGQLARAATPNAPLFEPMARWLGGDPSGFDDLEASELDTHERRSATVAVPYAPDWFNYGVFTAMVWASAGDRVVVARAVRLSRSVGLDIAATHNAVPLAVAEAAQAIVDHDEAAATRIIADLLAAHPLPDRTVELYLRRFLAIPYLCSPEARHRYDAEALGPAHRVARDASRALLGARRGGLGTATRLPSPAEVYTALPLPWSVELAARAHAAANPAGRLLAQGLVDRLGFVVEEELRRLTTAGAGDEAVTRGADRLLHEIPFPPRHTTRVEVLGPLRVLVDGEPVERPEHRRARVRELLEVLVLLRQLRRERAADLLWPALAPGDAARNLRVTLTHLRRLLEPAREQGTSGYHVRVEGDHLRLVTSHRLTVDLWDVDELLNAAARAERVGDGNARARHLDGVLQCWRGEPLGDLDRLDELVPEVQHVRERLIDATLALGEASLAAGDAPGTETCAERVLSVDPYAERALRLLIAAQVHRGDRRLIDAAVTRALSALQELAVEPQPETSIVLRQARDQLDAIAVGSTSGTHTGVRR